MLRNDFGNIGGDISATAPTTRWHEAKRPENVTPSVESGESFILQVIICELGGLTESLWVFGTI